MNYKNWSTLFWMVFNFLRSFARQALQGEILTETELATSNFNKVISSNGYYYGNFISQKLTHFSPNILNLRDSAIFSKEMQNSFAWRGRPIQLQYSAEFFWFKIC